MIPSGMNMKLVNSKYLLKTKFPFEIFVTSGPAAVLNVLLWKYISFKTLAEEAYEIVELGFNFQNLSARSIIWISAPVLQQEVQQLFWKYLRLNLFLKILKPICQEHYQVGAVCQFWCSKQDEQMLQNW